MIDWDQQVFVPTNHTNLHNENVVQFSMKEAAGKVAFTNAADAWQFHIDALVDRISRTEEALERVRRMHLAASVGVSSDEVKIGGAG